MKIRQSKNQINVMKISQRCAADSAFRLAGGNAVHRLTYLDLVEYVYRELFPGDVRYLKRCSDWGILGDGRNTFIRRSLTNLGTNVNVLRVVTGGNIVFSVKPFERLAAALQLMGDPEGRTLFHAATTTYTMPLPSDLDVCSTIREIRRIVNKGVYLGHGCTGSLIAYSYGNGVAHKATDRANELLCKHLASPEKYSYYSDVSSHDPVTMLVLSAHALGGVDAMRNYIKETFYGDSKTF